MRLRIPNRRARQFDLTVGLFASPGQWRGQVRYSLSALRRQDSTTRSLSVLQEPDSSGVVSFAFQGANDGHDSSHDSGGRNRRLRCGDPVFRDRGSESAPVGKPGRLDAPDRTPESLLGEAGRNKIAQAFV